MSIDLPRRYQTVQHRAADIEHVDVDSGEIVLRAAPYDIETQLDHELFESFAPKTFERAAAAPHRCKLWHEHNGPLIGHAVEVEDKPDGIWMRARLSNTLAGQEARELARDGTLDQCSITFRPMPEWIRATRKHDGLHIRHSRGYLLGCALVAHGAYLEHAYVASARGAEIDEAERERERRRAFWLALDH